MATVAETTYRILRARGLTTIFGNLTRLFIGSEGTLGVITSATLRLRPLPSCTGTATVDDLDSGDSALEDVVVPRTRLRELLLRLERISRESGTQIAVLGSLRCRPGLRADPRG